MLNFARENVKILSKLPVQLKDCAEKATIPELEDLTKIRDTVKPVDNTKRSTKGKEVNSFATQGTDQDMILNFQNQRKKENLQACLFCKEHHHLDKCKKFAEMPLRARKDFFFDKFLCFGCASSRQHQAASCKNKLVCRVCSAIHPCLHQPGGNAEVVSNCTNVCTIPDQEKGSDHAMIVPVWVRHISKPSQEVLQYAVLDDQSNVSFVSQSLCEQLDLQGSPTDLLLTTVQERNVHTPSSRICGLEVLDFNRKHTVKLPMLFTRDSIPASRSQIPKVSVAQEWEHLHPIADKLMSYEADKFVKEIINPQRIIKVLESDFVEGSTRSKSYSVEDKRFLSILENSIVKRADGHYEIRLPLKMDRLSLPYNRQLAVKRWHQLLARFKKNPKFLEDYQVFVKDVIDLCAEKVPSDRVKVQDGRINYVPHTGVYHPRKKDQIRVVFDCSAQFDGVCLNDYLLQGPDLLNTLLGILCRFRKERVAFMTDIKSMFHQFMVSEEHRDLLRFLCWEDGDPKKEVVEYRMKVHLFGTGSSPGCANFGLKKAADDGEAEYGNEAAEFIQRDFYVDDGLKSVGTIEEAVTLMKASQGICARAGLKLHKIMSNKREVLEAFPIEERA
ncbi:uncharacterized protein [Montipora capricornis]|uniref:uncharacterized protein n=1 Tax=Montipora capricornis TaxID=246305 RepID=UPI0035F1AE8C